eukprot:1555036-Prymnesium_polylepis.1
MLDRPSRGVRGVLLCLGLHCGSLHIGLEDWSLQFGGPGATGCAGGAGCTVYVHGRVRSCRRAHHTDAHCRNAAIRRGPAVGEPEYHAFTSH